MNESVLRERFATMNGRGRLWASRVSAVNPLQPASQRHGTPRTRMVSVSGFPRCCVAAERGRQARLFSGRGQGPGLHGPLGTGKPWDYYYLSHWL